MKNSIKAICLATVICLGLAGCGAAANSETAAAYPSAAANGYSNTQKDTGSYTGAAGNFTQEMGESTQSATGDGLRQSGRKIILNASLEMEALDFDASCAALLQALEKAGGYVSSTSVEGARYEGATRWAHYTFRVPADQYDAFLKSVGDAGNVLSKQESTEDITEAYVDVEARLKSLKTQEERLMEMMAQAGELETLLAIQKQLTEVQYQIESFAARQRVYDNQVDYSTVDIDVREVKHITEKQDTFGSRISAAFTGGWRSFAQGVQNLTVRIVYALPVLLVWACIIALVVLVGRVLHRRIQIKQKDRPRPAPYSYGPRGAQEPPKEETSADKKE